MNNLLQLDIIDETESVESSIITLLEDLLPFALQEEGITEETEVSLTFMDDASIQEVNREYRGKNQPTDVISFALEELGEGEIAIVSNSPMPRVLGDIIISVDTAIEQAKEYDHPLKREMGFLALHGLLHLLGYDHMTEEEEQEMFGRQKEILHAFGLTR